MIAPAYKSTEESRPAGENSKPRLGNRIEQQRNFSYPIIGSGCPEVCGTNTTIRTERGSVSYPYWNMLLWGIEPVYRLMRNHPTIALARSTVIGPVVASTWDLDWDDDADENAIAWVTKNILPLRRTVMRDAVRAVDYGWQPFALIWNIVEGKYLPTPRPLLPDSTVILEDKWGNYAGVENGNTKLNNLESWVATLDGEAGYKYGRSRYENLREHAWAAWLTTQVKAGKLESKLSGIIPLIFHPIGGAEDEDGNQVKFRDSANAVLEALPQGRGIALETIPFLPEDIMEEPKLANLPLFKVDFYDAGNVSQAQQGFISQLEYYDKQMFRGMLRGERTGLEAVSAGSRADTEQHTDTGTADSEEVDADLTWQFQAVVNTALRLNFAGQEGKIRLKAAPLLKRKLQVFRELMSRLTSVPELAIDIARALDLDAVFAQMSLPQLRKFTLEASMERNKPENKPVNSTAGDPKAAEKQARATADLIAERLASHLTI